MPSAWVTLKKPSPSMARSSFPPVFLRLPVVYWRATAWSLAPFPSWMPVGRLVLVELPVPARLMVW